LNLRDVASGLKAKRSKYTDGGRTGPGGETDLSIALLNGIEYLGARFDICISEIAGGVHSTTSSHYNGNTMDINRVNDIHASGMTPSQKQQFENACRDAGATYILYETSHYHIKF
jgi:zinc D-Ala-D-Ala carboxypeptidase